MNMDKKKIRVVVLGATGSVGTSALDVIRADRERFDVVGLSGRTRLAELAALCREFGCSRAVTADPARLEELRRLLPGCTCGAGISGMTELACAPETETLLCAVAGADGLLPVMEALKAGKKVALASKEVLVLAGDTFYLRDIVAPQKRFWNWASKSFRQVLLVPGNHEFYSNSDVTSRGDSPTQGFPPQRSLRHRIGRFHR